MLDDVQDIALNALRDHPDKELKVRQVVDALDGTIPERMIAIALAELAHRGLVHRRSEVRAGRKRSVQWYRAAD